MTPIFVRPVREQLEHDRLIRFLQTRYKRKFDVATNVGDQQLAPVRLGANTYFPDVVLMSGKKLAGLVEVETGESTNNLEAMAQWTHFSRARVPFHLYVPIMAYDAARRLCDANQVSVSEIWTYRAVNDQFDLVRVFNDPGAVKAGNKVAPKAVPLPKVVVPKVVVPPVEAVTPAPVVKPPVMAAKPAAPSTKAPAKPVKAKKAPARTPSKPKLKSKPKSRPKSKPKAKAAAKKKRK